MEVLLRINIPKLGKAGEKVSVNDGYARNYLFPQKLAEPVTSENLKQIEAEIRRRAAIAAKELEEFKVLANKLNNVSIQIAKKAGDDDTLYGSVTANDILAELTKLGYNIEKNTIAHDLHLKALGIFDVEIKLPYETCATIKVNVIRE